MLSSILTILKPLIAFTSIIVMLIGIYRLFKIRAQMSQRQGGSIFLANLAERTPEETKKMKRSIGYCLAGLAGFWAIELIDLMMRAL